MCDTVGKIKNKEAIFGKNSDREYDEPQIMVYVESKTNLEKKMKATYIEIDQIQKTHAILISKPIWMWGAEMGGN